MSPAAAQQNPVLFGKYELLECLGGGMADVYRARDRVTGKTVAIKILKREHSADEQMKARFLDEARTAAPLEHPHIINVFDFGEIDDRPYMVMEFLRGHDLRSAIRNGRMGGIVEKLRIAVQIVEAIQYIHSNGIVHRDIKPENIHIDTSGVARLIDFGIAKSKFSSLKTQLGFAVGTLAYMAPEQLVGNSTKLQLMDVYAFGLVLSEMLTGVRPVTGETEQQVCYRILNEPLDLDPLRKAAVPKPVIDLICRCTVKEPEKRIQSFDEIQVELSRLIASMCATPTATHIITQVAPPRPSRRVWMYPLIAVAALSAIALAYLAYVIKTPKPVSVATKRTPAFSAPPIVHAKGTDHHAPRLPDPAGDMVLVPAGEFLFGKDKEPRSLPDFYIDKTEVTNEAYARYAAAMKMRAPHGKPENPVVNVTAADARQFCEWAGKRLPSMYEWEKAARGTDGRDFPWGNQVEPWRANVKDNRERATLGVMPVGSFPEGQSIYGALNLAGNVWEFVSDMRPLTPQERKALRFRGNASTHWAIIYGGSFSGDLASNSSNAKSWDHAVVPPGHYAADIGFRCAK